MRTRPATITTIVIAIGLALTTFGVSRQLPYTFGGHGDVSSVAQDVWAHGTAISPSLVALIFLGILSLVAMRPTPGGRRAAKWILVVAIAVSLSSLAEPRQADAILLQTLDAVTVGVWALQISLIALVLSAIGEARRPEGQPAAMARPSSSPPQASSSLRPASAAA